MRARKQYSKTIKSQSQNAENHKPDMKFITNPCQKS